ncbi:MAG TPA: protein kinase [Fibrobacteria bacterium]|nr:protein kinase [Fibrobacteria bacterium]
MAANPQYAEGEVIANKYVVEALLGESPAARTFLANGSAGKLAVKFYRAEVSSRLLAAPDFFLKAGVMTEVEHDNLCACLDVQEEMGLVFVARAFTEGQSFEEWVRKHRGDANHFSRGLELLWQTCQGLAVMHERTRHLDIHPGNVIVGPLVARLCDWDPRALGNTEMTPDALPVRSEYQGYRAPEAAGRNGFLSYPSTDLFAVAGLLYRLVKGEHPSVDPAQTLAEILAFDKDLSVFLGKAMHPKPEERFQDAGAFSDALWGLQPAMTRLQERQSHSAPPRAAPRPVPEPAARMAEPLFPDPPQPASGNDSFFNFFPPAKPAGDTLFGSPPVPAQRFEAPKSGLADLEAPKPAPRSEPPAPARPPAVSLSALEKDPLEMAGNGEPGGFTAYGFKGAGDNRTGIYTPEAKAAAARTKLMILLGTAGVLILLFGLGGLFLFLRSNAAHKDPASEIAQDLPAEEPRETPRAQAPPPQAEPEPEPAARPEPASRPDPAPAAQAAAPETPYSDPPMPVEPPRPGAGGESPKAPQAAKPPKPVAYKGSTAYKGNSHVTAEREAALMGMVQNRTWPNSASECLKAGDELNDLGKTAEANVAYSKALIASDVADKQKILAFGGLAVTFQTMGMRDQARDAINQILAINPRNGFALKLKEKLR